MKHDGEASRLDEPQPEMMPMPAPEAAPAGEHGTEGQSNTSSKAGFVIAGLAALALIGYFGIGDFGGGGGETKQKPPEINTTGPTNSSSPILPVPPADITRAVTLLVMAEADKQKVQSALQSGKLKIGFVTLSDSDAEDGDWVTVTSGGFRQDVRLFKKPLLVAVPYLPGQPVRVTGLVDGDGGGITVAVHVGTSIVGLRPLKVGESVEVASP